MSGSIRLIDANLNRAREALRVMEDVARFVLDDGGLSGELKALRHEIRGAAESAGLDSALLIAWRDTPGDVGTDQRGAGEYRRETVAGIAVAAGKRAGEALRTLEEAFKVLPGGATAAERIKAVRYRVYEAERRLVLLLGSGRGRQWRLCVIITEALCAHCSWERVAEAAIEGGADCLQLREKDLGAKEVLRRARRLIEIARGTGGESGVAVIVNDRPDVALLAGADGVHVGQEDLAVGDVRRIAGSALLVGVSTANLAEARAAADAGADYCGVGPMFATTTKHKPVLAGPEYLKAYLADGVTGPVPHLAIGGVNVERARVIAEAGGRGVAVSSAVCGAEAPGEVCREIAEALRARAGVR